MICIKTVQAIVKRVHTQLIQLCIEGGLSPILETGVVNAAASRTDRCSACGRTVNIIVICQIISTQKIQVKVHNALCSGAYYVLHKPSFLVW